MAWGVPGSSHLTVHTGRLASALFRMGRAPPSTCLVLQSTSRTYIRSVRHTMTSTKSSKNRTRDCTCCLCFCYSCDSYTENWLGTLPMDCCRCLTATGSLSSRRSGGRRAKRWLISLSHARSGVSTRSVMERYLAIHDRCVSGLMRTLSKTCSQGEETSTGRCT